jgi:hypothetical protein
MPQRRSRFRDFKWAHPNKIKSHPIANDVENFTLEMLENISASCREQLVEHPDAYNYRRDVYHTTRRSLNTP